MTRKFPMGELGQPKIWRERAKEREVLGVSKLDGYTLASPAPPGNQLFIRTGEALYCIGKK